MPCIAAAELAATMSRAVDPRPCRVAGAAAVEFSIEEPDLTELARQSSTLAVFEDVGGLLRPVDTPHVDVMDDDLLTIPKYQGKTNEAFTQLMVHLAEAATKRPGPLDILDPLAGRGTTLLACWTAGNNGYGVEADPTSIEALNAYIRTYLRTKRIKHRATLSPVRREGRTLGKRLDVTARLSEATLEMSVMPGDTRDSRTLYGKRTFDAIVTDAPYGVVHGARRRGTGRDRSPRELLDAAIPIWVSQIRSGGSLVIGWNTLSLPREDLVAMLRDAGARVLDAAPWTEFRHRVDSSIDRDVVVATVTS